MPPAIRMIERVTRLELTKEGIGPRRLETYEEHPIISEQTIFYTYKRQSQSRSRSQRRATSVGPGVARWDEEEVDDDVEMVGVPAEGEDTEDWVGIQRGRDRIPRSASALPGTHDGSAWHRDGFSASRRSSYTGDSAGVGPPPDLEALSIAQRGPSPAYTPELRPMRSSESSRRSSLRLGSNNAVPSREPILSPIASAAPSRAASDRTGSTSTERRFSKAPQGSPEEVQHLPGVLESSEAPLEPRASSSSAQPRPILDDGSRRTSTTNVRFDDSPYNHYMASIEPSDAEDVDADEEGEGEDQAPDELPVHQSNRAASIRTNQSVESGSNTSFSNTNGPSSTAQPASAYHPMSDSVQAISSVSTPAHSRPPSVHARSSIEEPVSPLTHVPPHTSPLATSAADTLPPTTTTSRPPSVRDGRRSGLTSAASSTFTSPTTSRADLTEIRVGRSSRHGSHTTIVINHEENESAPVASSSTAPPATSAAEPRRVSGPPRAGPSRTPMGRRDSSEDRGRGGGKFSSLSAALRGLSQDVKDKVRNSSKSRQRNSSSVRGKSHRDSSSNAPPMPNGAAAQVSAHQRAGSAIPSRVLEDSMRSGRAVTRDTGPSGDFVPPSGRGGAARAGSGSRERKASPSPFRTEGRNESRSRGRNKGMKALTGAFHIGDGSDEEPEDEKVHHWKEFRKGE